MAELLRMPEVAANTDEATLSSWPVPENQPYAASDVIATIETAKAAVDVEADTDGVIIRQLVPAGTEVHVGEAIALIASPEETVDDVDEVLAALGVAINSPSTATERMTGRPTRASEPEAAAPEAAHPVPATPPGSEPRIFTSPLARRVARDAGLSLDSIAGTGPNGRIVRSDVERALAERSDPAPSVARPPSRSSSGTPAADYVDVPHTKIRRLIAQRLTESKQTIPHFYLRGRARVERLLELRSGLNGVSDVKISVNDLVIKAVACAHLRVPEVNVIWTPESVRQFSGVDLAVAVATDNGLVTPVLRHVDQLPIAAVAAAMQDVVARAKNGRLQQAELEGGSCAITNLGMFGTHDFAAIINPPQSAILAVGAAVPEPVVSERGGLEVATVMHVTLSVDHRCIDGALAAEWMKSFIEILEEPLRIIV